MKHDQQTYELIEQYLRGELAGEDLADFEQQLGADEELRQEVELQREVHDLLGDGEVETLDAKLTALGQEFGAAKEVKMFPLKRLRLVAAAVLILTVAYLGFFRNTGPTGEELFASYYEPYPADVISRANTDSVTIVEKAIIFYAEEQYINAGVVFAAIQNPNTRVHFYRGLTLVALQEDKLALLPLAEAAADENSVYQVPAQWYIALTQLRLNKPDEARELLETISQSASGKYQNLANDLLSAMD